MDNKEDNGLSFQAKGSRLEIAQSTSTVEGSADFGRSSTKWSSYRKFVTLIDTINHILIVVVTVFLLYYSLRTYSVTNLHAALCTIGYVLLMSESILILADENILTNFFTRPARVHLHWFLQFVGLIVSLVGVIVIYRVKTTHFRGIHAITGFVSLGIMCFLAIAGYPVFAAVKFRKIVRPVVIKFFHNFLGISCFVIGMVSQCYAYKKRWLSKVTGSIENIELICLILTALITIFSVRGAIRSLCSQTVSLFK